MCENLEKWALSLHRRGVNLYTVRYRNVQHNTMKANGPAALKQVRDSVGSVLTREGVEWYVHHKTCAAKLEWLSSKPQYNCDIERSFLGKNLVNLCHALGKEHRHLRSLQVDNPEDHPDGPGALHYYALEGTNRQCLMQEVAQLLPTDIYHKGKTLKTPR